MVSEQQAAKESRVRRGNKHYHNLGAKRYTNALLSIKHPIAMMYETAESTPVIRAILDEKGKNGAPLYAWIRFYANEAIKGQFEQRPHMVATIAERDIEGAGNRDGHAEILEKAIRGKRLLSLDKEKWNLLPVNARNSSTGIVTERFLNKNIAQFKKGVNAFKEKNRINYSLDTDSKRAQREKGIWALKDNTRMLDAKIGDGGDKYVSVAFDIHAWMRYT